jgi:carbamoyl-phosphate synthase large subunit
VKPLHVLITAASRRVPLVQAFQRALRTIGRPGRVIATDVNPLSPAVHFADRAYQVPLATDPEYVDELLAICDAERVRLVIPTIDDELPVVGAARVRFGQRGVLVACSPASTALLCDDKYATCRFLSQRGVSAAASWLPHELGDDLEPPLFIKPRIGRGGVGAFPVRNRRELQFFLEYVGDPVVQEFLAGPEFTIDVLCDFQGRPLSIVPRERAVIRAGVIDRGRTVKLPALFALAEAACRELRFAGPVNIQCRMRRDEPVIFEINPRFSGGIPLTIAAGADFPRMLLTMATGGRVEPTIGAFRENLWMTSYESSLFLEPARIALSTLAASEARAEVA